MLAVFTLIEGDGTVAVNPDHVVTVQAQRRAAPAKMEFTAIWLSTGESLKVTESYEDVVKTLNGERRTGTP